MFSQACVKNSIHRGEVYIPPRQTPTGQTPPTPGRHPPGQTLPPSDSHCSGRYASYWNAFLLEDVFGETQILTMSWSGIPSVSAPLLLSVRSCRINGSCDLSPSLSPIAPSSVEWTLMSLGVTTSSRLNTSSSLGSSARSFGNRAPVDVKHYGEDYIAEASFYRLRSRTRHRPRRSPTLCQW